jgi:hypothetical protein
LKQHLMMSLSQAWRPDREAESMPTAPAQGAGEHAS